MVSPPSARLLAKLSSSGVPVNCSTCEDFVSLFVAGEAVQVARMGMSSKATAFMFNFMVMMQSTTSPDLFAVLFTIHQASFEN